jgi:hypothetical protein
MNLQPLADELAKPEYASLTDQEAADAINSKTVVVSQLVPNWQIKQHAILNGYWPVVKAGQLDADPQKAGLCLSVIDWVDDSRIQNTDMNLPGVQTMIGGLVQFGLVTDMLASQLFAMSQATIAWTKHVGVGEVGRGIIQNLRRERQ